MAPPSPYLYCDFLGCEIVVARVEDGRVIGKGAFRAGCTSGGGPMYCSRHNTVEKRRP